MSVSVLGLRFADRNKTPPGAKVIDGHQFTAELEKDPSGGFKVRKIHAEYWLLVERDVASGSNLRIADD